MFDLQQCKECGELSVPYFGFDSPCPQDSVGTHRDKMDVQISKVEAARLLKEAYRNVPHFDRKSFYKHASKETKMLLYF